MCYMIAKYTKFLSCYVSFNELLMIHFFLSLVPYLGRCLFFIPIFNWSILFSSLLFAGQLVRDGKSTAGHQRYLLSPPVGMWPRFKFPSGRCTRNHYSWPWCFVVPLCLLTSTFHHLKLRPPVIFSFRW